MSPAARLAVGLGMSRVAASLSRTGLWAHKTAATRVVSSAAGLMGVRGLAGGALSARAHSPPSPCRSSSVLRPGSAAWGGHASPVMWRRGDFMRSAPSRSMCEEAEEKQESKEKGIKVAGAGKMKNLYELLMMLEDFGVGYRVAKRNWAKHYDNSYWVVTRVSTLSGKHAWGVKVWKGEVASRETRISGLWTRGRYRYQHKVPGEMEAVLQRSREMVAKHEEAKAARLAVRRAQRVAEAAGGGVQQSA